MVALLREGGLAPGASVLDVGCGSGLLARQLRAAGFAARGVDASPAMIELARDYEPAAKFDVVRLPIGLHLATMAPCPSRMLWCLPARAQLSGHACAESQRH